MHRINSFYALDCHQILVQHLDATTEGTTPKFTKRDWENLLKRKGEDDLVETWSIICGALDKNETFLKEKAWYFKERGRGYRLLWRPQDVPSDAVAETTEIEIPDVQMNPALNPAANVAADPPAPAPRQAQPPHPQQEDTEMQIAS